MRVENPRWRDAENGILAENTRVIKVFVQYPDGEKIFPFIIDKITDTRDNNFQVMKQVEASGLAFAELGKTGYKLEFSQQTIEDDWEENDEVLPTMNYWLDKVFPNEKDSDGKITRWLTPWSYEIRMDWSGYVDEDARAADKMYEDVHVSSWNLSADNELEPGAISELEEKSRIIDASESNRYNITQTIAETFGVFCIYEYKCDNQGHFVKSYTKDDGSAATGRVAVFYNKAIHTDNPLHFTYQHNLQTVSRTLDSSELYSKLYVSAIESDEMNSGYVTIADAASNPLREDFILNFDYLYSVGSINDFQKQIVKEYEVSLHSINTEIAELEEKINNQTIQINEASADQTSAEQGVKNAQEQQAEYGTLANAEIYTEPTHKDVNNRYTAVFVPDSEKGLLICTLKLEGVLVNGYNLSCYRNKDYNDTTQIFTSKDIKFVSDYCAPESDTQIYGVLDSYGFLTTLFTSQSNKTLVEGEKLVETGAIVYLDLYYSPKNKYEAIMEEFANLEQLNQQKYDDLTAQLEKLNAALEESTKKRDDLLEQKEQLNYRFERLMGGALREGYWTPDDYDDVGQLVKFTTISGNSPFIWDTEPFDEETLPYYYATVEGATSETKTYYPYIDLSNVQAPMKNDFCIYLEKPTLQYVTTTYYKGGPAFVILDSTYYYFDMTGYEGEGIVITLDVDKTRALPIVIAANGTEVTVQLEALENANNYTSWFEGLSGALEELRLYPNAGFTYGFINDGGIIKPIALLDNDSIDYSRYEEGANYYKNDLTYEKIGVGFAAFSDTTTYVYPRIFIDYENVNYDSDEFSVKRSATGNEGDSFDLEKYIDYTTLLRDWKPYITLKITENCSAQNILEQYFLVSCRVSRANEQLYLDAKQVALDNSQPKYSYELSVANIPDELSEIQLGQLAYINDHSLGIYQATGYVSGFTLTLDQPSEDTITIQNYKTKFEDLFSTITASSEAMKTNQRSYDIAASGFTAGGALASGVLEKSLASSSVSFNYSKTKVAIDNTGGITLTNETPYSNGVYGQVALRGGGIYCSNSVDDLGNRIWNSAITPTGINATAISAGQLDTNTVRIFSGDNMAFQWNSEGLYAYDTDAEGAPALANYVRLSQDGLEYVENSTQIVSLGWDGLKISAQDGAVSLTGSDGLIVKNAQGQTVVALGKSDDELYGLRMYQDNELNFYADNDGQLYLKKNLEVGDSTGINGSTSLKGISPTTGEQTIMLWAGADKDSAKDAPFIVFADGSIKASSGQIGAVTIAAIEQTVNAYTVKVECVTGLIIAEGAAIAGKTLQATIYQKGLKVTPSATYTWQQSTDGDEWTAMKNNSTEPTYTLTTTDVGPYYRCLVLIDE